MEEREMEDITTGELIKELRQRLLLSKRAVALRADTTTQIIHRLESNREQLTWELADKLARIFNVRITFFNGRY